MVASKTNIAAAVTAATDAGLICKIALLFFKQERFHVTDYSIGIEIPCRVDLPHPAVWIDKKHFQHMVDDYALLSVGVRPDGYVLPEFT